jgi:hypothetical protein
VVSVFKVPTRQTGEYKVDLTRHPKFALAFGELASGCFPHCTCKQSFGIKQQSLAMPKAMG